MTTFQFLGIWLTLLIGVLSLPGCGGETETGPFTRPNSTRYEGHYTVILTVKTRCWAYNQQQADRLAQKWIEQDITNSNRFTTSDLHIQPHQPEEKAEAEP